MKKILLVPALLLIVLILFFPARIFSSITSVSNITLNSVNPPAGSILQVSWNYNESGSPGNSPRFIILISTQDTLRYSGSAGQWLMIGDGCVTPALPATAVVASGGCNSIGNDVPAGVNSYGPVSFTLPAELVPGITYRVIVVMRDYGVTLNSGYSQFEAQNFTTFSLPLPPAAISVTKTAESDNSADDLRILYTVKYSAVNINNVIITDAIPPQVDFVEAFSGGSVVGSNVVWNLGNIASPVTGTVEWVAQVKGTTPADTLIYNTAGVSSTELGVFDTNTTTTTTQNHLQIGKSASPNVINVLENVTFSMTYTNTGYTFIDLVKFDGAGDISDWTQDFSAGAGSWTVNGGVLKGVASGSGFPKIYKNAPVQHDGIYQVDATVQSGTVGDAVLIFCSQSPGNEYHARFEVDDNTIELDTVKGGAWTGEVAVAAPVGFTLAGKYGEWFTIKAQVRGGNIKIKVWPAGTAEPAAWAIDYNDPTPLTLPGRSGVQVDQVENWFDNFKVFGPGPATNTRIYDTLPPCTTYLGCTGTVGSSCSYNAGTNMVTWNFPGWLDDVQSPIVRYWVRADICAGGTILTNIACIDSDENAPPDCSNIATVYVTPATPTFSPTFTVTPTITRTATRTVTQTATQTATPTNSPTPTFTSTPSITNTTSPSVTQTVTPTYTATRTFTRTTSPTATPTATRTATQTATPSASPTATRTFTQTATATASPTATRTVTMTATRTVTRTITPTCTVSPTTVLPKMQLVKSAAPNPAQPGNTVSYSITYWNYGLAPATGFVIYDDISPYLEVITPVPVPGNYDSGLRRVTWNIGTVPAQSTPVTVNFAAIVSESITADTNLTNIAHSTNTEDPPDIPSNTTDVTVDVPALQLTPHPNTPNPAKGGTNIIFWVSVRANVTLKFYTISGEPIRTMQPDEVRANLVDAVDVCRGYNRVYWDLQNGHKKEVASGIYFYRVIAESDNGEHAQYISKLAVLK